MIHLKEVLKEDGNLLCRIVVRSNWLSSFFGVPEFYFANIEDYQDNIGNVPEGTLVLFPKVYYRKKGNSGEIIDDTGRLDARVLTMWTDYGLSALIGTRSPDKLIERISLGRDLFHVGAQKQNTRLLIETFYLNPIVDQSMEGMDYLRCAFPLRR